LSKIKKNIVVFERFTSNLTVCIAFLYLAFISRRIFSSCDDWSPLKYKISLKINYFNWLKEIVICFNIYVYTIIYSKRIV
jgi:hypothetical protein